MIRRRLVRHCMPLLLIVASIAPAVGEEQLGRLFFSPERRATLDRQRELNQQPAQEVPEDPTFRIDGLVVRSTGHKTLWIDGAALHDEAMSPGIPVDVKPHSAGEVVIGTTAGARSTAHVGDTVVRSTGEATDGLNGGHIHVPQRPRKR